MRKTALRTLELLETEERAGQETDQSSLAAAAFLCWKVVFAHYLGDLKPDDEDPGEAGARVLGYDSQYEYMEALFEGEIAEIKKRFKDACRRLFGQLDLDFDHSSPSASIAAFVRLIDKLPEQWSHWIESNSQVSRNSRVFTQIGKAALGLVRIPEHLLLPHLKRQEAKVCFWAFRRYTRPGMKSAGGSTRSPMSCSAFTTARKKESGRSWRSWPSEDGAVHWSQQADGTDLAIPSGRRSRCSGVRCVSRLASCRW